MIKTQKAIQYFQNKSTAEITEEEWEFLRNSGVCNGCGGKDCVISHFLASLIAPIFFEASCDKHDFGYWKGGDEERRKECDKKFFSAMLRDIRRQPIILYPYFFLVAVGFYLAVRIGGKKYFNFTNK